MQHLAASLASEPECLRICATTLGGKQFPLDLVATDTIKCVKAKIAEMSGLHTAQQRLFRRGEELQDESELASYGMIRANSIFTLAVSAPKQLSIYIEGTTNGCFSMEVEETQSVKALKEKLQEQLSVRWEEHCLVFGGEEVADDKTLVDYSVAEGATLQLEVRKPLWVQSLAFVVALLGLLVFLRILMANLP